MTVSPVDHRRPVQEVRLDVPLVRSLLADQHPDLSNLPVVLGPSGWDNVLFRLGDDLVVRMPRRAMGAHLILHEQRWLPQVAAGLPFAVPVPLRMGRPGFGYPWHWSICEWFPGVMLADAPPHDPAGLAVDLGGFVAAMHRPAPGDAPRSPWRGIPLSDRAELTATGIHELADVPGLDRLDLAGIERRWDVLRNTSPHRGPPMWLHGDLHPANIVMSSGRLAAVVDFGDLTAGDPACDLSVAWMALPPEDRAAFRVAAGHTDDHTWRRAQGWALALAVAFLRGSSDDPVIKAIGERTLDTVMEESL
jgi:aminoglycoside phosphotransferase (APT) family kinase protein